MEGKFVLFKTFAGVDSFPICLATNDIDEIVQTVKLMEPTFGGINLEDIAAPDCFIIEERLKKETRIPIFHDDQHGTARSEEHTSELQSRGHLVCSLLLE